MNLLIDLGNTRLKWAITSQPNDINPGLPIGNAAITPDSLFSLWQGITKPDIVAIASVSASLIYDRVLTAIDKLWPGTIVFKAESQISTLGVTTAYKQPEKLGVDRWLSMVAAYHQYRKAFCLAGCGTAITVDVVDASGKHQGGLIAPGIRLMQHALAAGTENLNSINESYPDGLAAYTEAAIYNGTLYAACGLIEHVLTRQSPAMELILTGGDAGLIAQRLLRPAIIEPDLVLLGLALTLAES